MFVNGSPLVDAVAFDERVLPETAGEVNVAKVLPSKFEGTVGIGTFSPPDKLCDALRVRTDRDVEELSWAKPRPTTQAREIRDAFMVVAVVPLVQETMLYRSLLEKRVTINVAAET